VPDDHPNREPSPVGTTAGSQAPGTNLPTLPTRVELQTEMLEGKVRSIAFARELGPEILGTMRDARDWSGLDHLGHLNAWERALISWLEGGTQAEGLGVPESLWQGRDIDAINEAVRSNHRSETLDEILEELDRNRRQLIGLVGVMSDDDLSKPYSHYPPDDPDLVLPTVAHRVRRVVGSHVDDHLGYIRRMSTEGA
jgi:hypothetical protein